MKEVRSAVSITMSSGTQVDFRALFADHGPWLIELARSVTGSRTDAEDVVQEAFLRAYRGRRRFRGDSDPRHWLKRIVVNAAIDLLRRRRVVGFEAMAPDALPAPRPDPHTALVDEERADAVRRAVRELPEHQRTVLMLREFGGLTYREIAQQLGLKRGTVESRVIRARERLRAVLGRLIGEGTSLGERTT